MVTVGTADVLAELTRIRDEERPGALKSTLEAIVRATVQVFGGRGAGVMIVDEQAVPRYVVASDTSARVLEDAQERLGAGPCVDAIVYDGAVVVDDLAADDRWPELSQLVVPEGVRSVVGIPIVIGGAPIGSINVFWGQPQHWQDDEVTSLRAFGGLVEHVLGEAVLARRQDDLVAQLQFALDNRVVIERAVGLLMGRDGSDAVSAFRRLRQLARSERRRVRDVAEDLVGRERR